MNIESNDRVRAAGVLLMLVDSPGGNQEPCEFLLMRHQDRWDLPKGHCEEGESFLVTALRETEEETGITSDQIQIDATFSFDLRYPVKYSRFADRIFEKHVRYFLGFVDFKPELTITEHESASWFPWRPPQNIQSQTIDPLLAAVASHLE